MKDYVKKLYGAIAKGKTKSCCGSANSCGSGCNTISEKVGYSKEELSNLPIEADMGLGCGNPLALISLREGEMVVDLGSGGGIDAFLAARRVGDKGKVIGIDMTEEMIKKARANARKGNYKNVEFKLGDIEKIPLEDSVADCVTSNCVINLAEDKQKVFNESYRILKRGGRLMISDMVLTKDLPEKIAKSAEMYVGCIAGALIKEDYLNKIRKAGFSEIKIMKEDAVHFMDYLGSDKVLNDAVKNMSKKDISQVDNMVVSIKVYAKKDE